ncbi:MAG: class I SAM-dependent methyltransferase [Proteobacteria bacterium]|nr:class I SAM-dependent methyltransferase [Pseudomonadota bacterium]NBP15297.1 class I SAM-dependent methyltransferase [bacterium]
MVRTEDIGGIVKKFYGQTPFNLPETEKEIAEKVRSRNIFLDYAPIPPEKFKDKAVIEFGCGSGWLSLCLSYYFKSQVTAVDFNEKSLLYANSAQKILGTNVRFVCADFTTMFMNQTFDWIISVGVLHHTANAMKNLDLLIKKYLRENGNVLIGLYHKHRRSPFLEHIKKLKIKSHTESHLISEYRKLDKRFSQKQENHFLSWFHDQVMHPFESQHTLKEVLKVFSKNQIKFEATSLNQFKTEDLEKIFLEESKQEKKAQIKLKENIFDPGFFIVYGSR